MSHAAANTFPRDTVVVMITCTVRQADKAKARQPALISRSDKCRARFSQYFVWSNFTKSQNALSATVRKQYNILGYDDVMSNNHIQQL